LIVTPETNPRWNEQVELETQMIASGMTAFFNAERKAAEQGRAADAGAPAYLSALGLKAVIEGATELLSPASNAMRRKSAFLHLKGMPADVVAAVSLKTAINWLSRPTKSEPYITAAAEAVGEALEGERMVLAYQQAHPAIVEAIISKLDKTTNHAAHRRRVIMASMRKNNFTVDKWDKRTKVLVGLKMLEVLLERTGMFESPTIRHGRTVQKVFRFTQEALDLLTTKRTELSRTMPSLAPCVIPPKPWDARGRDGGYWTPVSLRPITFVKGKYRELLPGDVVEAVNTLQDTGWKVNDRVLAVMRDVVYENKDHLGVLPPVADVPIPPKPDDIDTNEVARSLYREKAAAAYTENASRRSKRIMVYRALGLAEKYEKYQSIYFPHNVDFRGRVYPISQWLHPQGSDFVKGLLLFDQGKPIGDEQGPGWLAIHGANCFGVDKVSLEDRIDWVEQHDRDIRAVASDPLQCLWWTEADSPWCFLAFCFEWAGYRDAATAGNGAAFVSSLPVMVDGSCNGIQHFSAMLRDPVGGRAVNLVPSDRPSDIYGSVAERVKARLREEVDARTEHSDVAAKWLAFGIDRKTTKRSVMVLPYGGTFTSCRAYVSEAVADRGATPWSGDPDAEWAATFYLAKVVWASIGDVVVGARTAMAWLQALAKLVMKHGGKEVWWRTPTGLLARQRYRKFKDERINTVFCGKAQQVLSLRVDTEDPDKTRQVNGFSPNFVHSLDASALIETVLLAKDHGVTHFAAVHDSYGTHASDMSTLSACIRHAFVSLYENHDVLDNLYHDIKSQLPEGTEVPPPPQKGTLDIKEVLNSDFFFA
jgi:DNA-directed RNA polymerase